ncbi:MAG: YdcF family protein [Elainellaceae cyanobacterium]
MGVLLTVFVLLSIIPVRLAIAHIRSPQPGAFLVLGGSESREQFTAQFAQTTPDLPIWVSTGMSPARSQQIFQQADIPDSQLYLDRQAIDTVTNFTTLVSDFQQRDIQHVYLVTSDYHMPRARAIAFFVFGSRGIATTPLIVPSSEPEESPLKIARDVGRSLLWIATGHTGASLHPNLRDRHTLRLRSKIQESSELK